MQIKTTIRHCFIPVRMPIIKMITNSKYWQGYGEKGTLVQCCWECKSVHTSGEKKHGGFSKK